MPPFQYDIRNFLDQCLGLSRDEILRRGQFQYNIVFAVSKPNTAAARFLWELEAFVGFLKTGIKPDTAEFQNYFPAIKSLVDKGEFVPAILDLFHESSAS